MKMQLVWRGVGHRQWQSPRGEWRLVAHARGGAVVWVLSAYHLERSRVIDAPIPRADAAGMLRSRSEPERNGGAM